MVLKDIVSLYKHSSFGELRNGYVGFDSPVAISRVVLIARLELLNVINSVSSLAVPFGDVGINKWILIVKRVSYYDVTFLFTLCLCMSLLFV